VGVRECGEGVGRVSVGRVGVREKSGSEGCGEGGSKELLEVREEGI